MEVGAVLEEEVCDVVLLVEDGEGEGVELVGVVVLVEDGVNVILLLIALPPQESLEEGRVLLGDGVEDEGVVVDGDVLVIMQPVLERGVDPALLVVVHEALALVGLVRVQEGVLGELESLLEHRQQSMLSAFLCVLLQAGAIRAILTTTPKTRVKHLSLNVSHFEVSDREFQYIYYPGAHDVEIFLKEDITDEFRMNEFENKKGSCWFQQRRTHLSPQLSLQLMKSQQAYFTDFQIVPALEKAYLVRNDLQIFEIEYSFQKDGYLNRISYPSEQNYSFAQDLQLEGPQLANPKFVFNQLSLFVITEFGAIKFQPANQTLHNIEVVEINLRQQIRKVVSNEHYVAVVCGKEGVDVYSLTLDLKFIQNIPVAAISAQLNGDLIYVLTDQGIRFYDLKTFQEDSFHIPLKNAVGFAYSQNSFVVAAKTSQGITFAVEILLNHRTEEYVYNKFYLEDMQLNDVQFFRDLGFLIGSDAHKIIYTNIYKQFVDTLFDYDEEFVENNLQKIDFIDHNSTTYQGFTTHYMFSLSQNEFKTYFMKQHSAELVCHATRDTRQSYIVLINSTDCGLDSNPFELCQYTHNFTLSVYKTLVESDQQWQLELVVGGVVLLLLLLGCCSYLLSRRWKKIIMMLQTQQLKLEQKKRYHEMNELPFSSPGQNKQADPQQKEQDQPQEE